MTFQEKSDEDLRKIAEEKNKDLYELEQQFLQQNTQRKKQDFLNAINEANENYEEKAEYIRNAYAKKGADLSNEALSKGMGRSSYAQYLQQANLNERDNTLQQENEERLKNIESINNQIETLEEMAKQESMLMDKKKQDAIDSLIEKLKAEQEKEREEVIKYNNNLALQLAKEQAASSSRSSKSSSKSSSKKKSSSSKSKTLSREQQYEIVKEYGQMSPNQRIAYFYQNEDMLKKFNKDFYQYMKNLRDSDLKHSQIHYQ